MKQYILIVVIIGISLASCAQKRNEEFILGKWVVYKTTDQTGDSLTPFGTIRSNRPDTLEFLPEGKINIYYIPIPGEPPQKSSYSFENDSILLVGNRMYIFKKIDDERMILDDYDPTLPQIKSIFSREYWRRVKQ